MSKQTFYNTPEWLRAREAALLRDHYLCVQCLERGKFRTATTVHHIQERKDRPDLALNLDNLKSLCAACHNKAHPDKGRRAQYRERRIPGSVRIIKI